MASVDKETEKLVYRTLQDLLRQLYEIEAIVGDFTQPNSQELLSSRLQEFSQGLQLFKEKAPAYNGFEVPTALCRFIDDGGHPDDYVRLAFRTAVADSQLAKGRVEAIKSLRDGLMAQATEAFPDDAAAYNAVVDAKLNRVSTAAAEAPKQ